MWCCGARPWCSLLVWLCRAGLVWFLEVVFVLACQLVLFAGLVCAVWLVVGAVRVRCSSGAAAVPLCWYGPGGPGFGFSCCGSGAGFGWFCCVLMVPGGWFLMWRFGLEGNLVGARPAGTATFCSLLSTGAAARCRCQCCAPWWVGSVLEACGCPGCYWPGVHDRAQVVGE